MNSQTCLKLHEQWETGRDKKIKQSGPISKSNTIVRFPKWIDESQHLFIQHILIDRGSESQGLTLNWVWETVLETVLIQTSWGNNVGFSVNLEIIIHVWNKINKMPWDSNIIIKHPDFVDEAQTFSAFSLNYKVSLLKSPYFVF